MIHFKPRTLGMRSTTWLMCAASLLAPVLTSPVADSVARSVAIAAPCEVRPLNIYSYFFVVNAEQCLARGDTRGQCSRRTRRSCRMRRCVLSAPPPVVAAHHRPTQIAGRNGMLDLSTLVRVLPIQLPKWNPAPPRPPCFGATAERPALYGNTRSDHGSGSGGGRRPHSPM